MKRIIIIEDHPIVVFNLKQGLHNKSGIEVIETFNSGKSLLASKILNSIDVALMDINLPDYNGFELCKFLKSNYPSIKIIGISSFDDYEHISMLIEKGANGYIIKGAKNSEMIDAINTVMNGETYLCQTADLAIKNNSLQGNKSTQLTKFEQKLLNLLHEYPSLELISESLGEEPQQVSNLLKMLKQKIEFYQLKIDVNTTFLN